jgi:hypothetical protein
MLGKCLARLLVLGVTALPATAKAQTPPVTVSPTSLAFGNVALGTSLNKSIVLTNNQSIALTISRPNIVGSGDFALAPGGSCGSTLGAGKSCAYHLAFTPSALGPESATLMVNDNASNSPQQVSLSGTGSSLVTDSPTILKFSSQLITTTSAPKTVTLTNNQGISLNLLAPGITGNFSLIGGSCGSNLSAFSKCTYLVTFTPPSVGNFTGSLTINLGGSNPAMIVTLTGTGGTTGIQSLSVNPVSASILKGTNQQFTATANLSNGGTIAVTTIAHWSSSNSKVATVNAAGLAAAVGAGTAVVKVSLSSTLNSSATLISLPVLVSITMTPQNPSVPLGNTLQFVATGSYSDGSKQDLTSAVTWNTSAVAVAYIGSGGLAVTTAQGNTTISTSLGSIIGSTTLKVAPPAVVSIAVTPTNFSLPVGASQQLTATGIYSDGSNRQLTAAATWTSSNISVANVGSGGIAMGASVGNTIVSAVFGSITGSTALMVSPSVLQSIAVTPMNGSLPAGSLQQFTATGIYSDGTTVDVTSLASWISSDSAAAVINSSGLATGVTSGWTTLTANFQSGSGSTVLNITQPGTVIQSITVTPNPSSVSVGSSQQFIATGNFSDGSTRDLTSAALWYINPVNARYPSDPSFGQYVVPSSLVTGVLVELGWNMVDMGPGTDGGQYQWSSFDATYVIPYTSSGKKVNLSVWAQNYPSDPSTTPSYVQAYTTNSVPDCNSHLATWIAPPYSSEFLAAYKSFMAEVVRHYAGNPAIGYVRVGLSAGGETYRYCGPTLDGYAAPFPYSDPPFNCSTAPNVGQCVWLAYDQDMLDYVQSQNPTFTVLGPSTSQNQNGSDPNNVYPSTEDDQAVAHGFGFGSQGLEKSDLTNYASGLPCISNWCAKFNQYSGQVPLELQTAVPSDPTCTGAESSCANTSGSLVDLLPFSDSRHATIFEIYEGDLYVALKPSDPNYTIYGTQYSAALQNTLQSNPIASVNSSGIVTGVTQGSTTIFVQYGGVTGSAAVDVSSSGPMPSLF